MNPDKEKNEFKFRMIMPEEKVFPVNHENKQKAAIEKFEAWSGQEV